MRTELKEKFRKSNNFKRKITIRSLLGILKNSLNGIKSYAIDGKSIILYIIGFIIEIILGFTYHVNGLEWILIICILGIILSVELINTAIEAVCDAVTKEFNPLIKISKDCASAATFVIFIVAVILNIIIFYPKIIGFASVI